MQMLAKLCAAGGGEEAVVRRLREGARGGGGRQEQDVRGLERITYSYIPKTKYYLLHARARG